MDYWVTSREYDTRSNSKSSAARRVTKKIKRRRNEEEWRAVWRLAAFILRTEVLRRQSRGLYHIRVSRWRRQCSEMETNHLRHVSRLVLRRKILHLCYANAIEVGWGDPNVNTVAQKLTIDVTKCTACSTKPMQKEYYGMNSKTKKWWCYSFKCSSPGWSQFIHWMERQSLENHIHLSAYSRSLGKSTKLSGERKHRLLP